MKRAAPVVDICTGETIFHFDLPPRPSFSLWLATEGLRRCPLCGRFAKAEELGSVGFVLGAVITTAFGHLPGKGCQA